MKRNVDKKMTHVHNATILGLKIIETQLTGKNVNLQFIKLYFSII